MPPTLYLAESTATYRQLIPRLVKGYFQNLVDLWENPSAVIDLNRSDTVLLIDEAFIHFGPGPARSTLQSLLEHQKITKLPVILLRRRQTPRWKLPLRIHQLRRPFYFHELQSILDEVCPGGRQFMEETMIENETVGPISTPSSETTTPELPGLDREEILRLTQETLEKVIRELIPPLAEKIIREEIQRLTE